MFTFTRENTPTRIKIYITIMTTFLHKSLFSFLAFSILFISGIASEVYAGGPVNLTSGILYDDGSSGVDINDYPYEWTVPCGVTSIDVQMWGGGGAGGGQNGESNSAGGGDAGMYVSATYNVVPGEVISVDMGEGGVGGGGAGDAGTATTLTGGVSGLLGSAAGGAGGCLDCIAGLTGGTGGTAAGGGGAGGVGGTDHNAGSDGSSPGGGGGGGNDNGGGSKAGGDGGSGGLILTYTAAVPNAGGPISLGYCNTSTALLADESPYGAGTGTWTDGGAGGSWDDDNSPTAVYSGMTAGNTYTLTWTIDDGGGLCPTDSDISIITVDPAPTSVADGDLTVCGGGNANLSATGTNGTFLWDDGGAGGSFDDATSLTAVYTAPAGPTSVTLTLTTTPSGGCPPVSSFYTLTVTAGASPAIAGSNQVLTACATGATLGATDPLVGTGAWTCISGDCGTITPAIGTLAFDGVITGGLTPGVTTVLEWSVTTGGCPPNTSQVTIEAVIGPSCVTYCEPAPDNSDAAYNNINNVTFQNINNSVANSTTPYTDFTGQVAYTVVGGTYSFSFTGDPDCDGNGFCDLQTSCVTVLIDWDGNGDFSGPNELNPIGTINSTDQTITGDITVPAGAVLNTELLMRVVLSDECPYDLNDPCPITGEGSVHDYSVSVCNIPDADAGPDVFSGDCNVNQSLDAVPATGGVWSCTSGCAGVSIDDVNLATSGVTLVAGQETIFTWTVTDGSCVLFDQVVFNNSGPGCVTYCVDPTPFSLSTVGHISSVQINGGTATTSGWDGYADNTSPCVNVLQGSNLTVDIDVFHAAAYNLYTSVWIDWNGNGFYETDEEYNFGSSTATPTLSINSNVPCGAAIGDIRMRVVMQYNNPITDPCVTVGSYGDVEEYCFTVGASVPPTADAQDDYVACGTSANLDASGSSIADGFWTILSGSGTIADNTDPTTTIDGLLNGTTVVQWTATGLCDNVTAQTTMVVSGLPDASVNAGIDLFTCEVSANLAASMPDPYTGQWVVGAGAPSVPTFTPNINDPNAVIGNLVNGIYNVEWQVLTGAPCNTVSDDLIITVGSLPVPDPGLSVVICPQSVTLDATPVAGVTGTWSITGGGDLLDVNDPTTTAYNLAVGSYTATWTLTGGGCPGSTSADITITVNDCQTPLTQDPNQDQFVTGCNFQFTDDGGTTGPYTENVVSTQTTICPDSPDQYVTIDFTTIDLGTSVTDNLVVFDSDSPSAPIIGYADGAGELQLTNPQYTANTGDPITSSVTGSQGGCLIVVFTSFGTNTGSGWIANTACTTTQGTPITQYISGTNCGGGGGITLCVDSLDVNPDTQFQGGQMDLNVGATNGVANGTGNQGCLGSGESNEQWVYFNIESAGDIQFLFNVAGGQDFDFAIWGPYSIQSCPLNTGDTPIRCSWATTGNNGCTGSNLTGLAWVVPAGPYTAGNSTVGDLSEDGNGCDGLNDGFVEPIMAQVGDVYTMLVNNYANNNSNYSFDYTGTAGLGCNPPPVVLGAELMDFTGLAQVRENRLLWKTATEENNDYFVIEASTNAYVWSELGRVKGFGNSQTEESYSFDDNIMMLPLTYYRLKQVDYDGEFTYSQVIAVSRKFKVDKIASSIFPNPSTGQFYFKYGGKDNKMPINIEVVNSLGQTVMLQEYVKFNKHVALSIDASELAEGLYQVKISQGDVFQTQKISVVK